MSKKLKESKINKILEEKGIKNRVQKPLGKTSLEIFLRNNNLNEEEIKEIINSNF